MNKRTLLFWLSTVLFCLMMLFSGVVNAMHLDAALEVMRNLGYPDYVLTILGVWKILGVLALLAPGFPLLKEWAYAGFAFDISGAFFSHLAVGAGLTEALGPLLFLGMGAASYLLRPESRRIR